MNIEELSNRLQEISLNCKPIKAFFVGNTWDMNGSKSSENYPCVWQEFPILVTYGKRNQKTYTFSLDVLMLAKSDDLQDELHKTSEAEILGDVLMQAFTSKIDDLSLISTNGLTVKNINVDKAVGIRLDFQFVTNVTCDFESYFKEKMDRV